MSDLTSKELDLLKLIDGNETLQFYAFTKMKGLKWFDELQDRGFFEPSENPEPSEPGRAGPLWNILPYLLKTSEELTNSGKKEYINKYLDLLEEVTLYTAAKDSQKRNYRTWERFSQILSNIPPSYIKKSFIEEIVSKWQGENFKVNLVIDNLGNKLLPSLLNDGRKEASLALLKIIMAINKNEESKYQLETFSFSSGNYQINNILSNNLENIAILGIDAVNIWKEKLTFIFKNSDKDRHSFILRPAIEKHEQNRDYPNVINILISTYRDLLLLIINNTKINIVESHLLELLNSKFVTFKRIVIYLVNKKWNRLQGLELNFLKDDFFNYNYQHELFWFLKEHFYDMKAEKRKDVLRIINNIAYYSDEEYKKEQIAYKKLIWLTAIKWANKATVPNLYHENYEVIEREPDHPDFASYMKTGFVGDKSPLSSKEILMMEVEQVVKYLNDFESNEEKLFTPNKRGLANEFLIAIKSNLNKVFDSSDKIISLKDLYLSQIIKSFTSLWKDEKKYNYERSLALCYKITNKRQDLYKKTNSLTLSNIAKYIIEGTKSDSHAFSEDHFTIINKIIENLLTQLKSKGNSTSSTSDDVNQAINSNKGVAIEALFNYSLRKCRLANKNSGSHTEAWKSVEQFYNSELEKRGQNNFEFHALATKYLPNLLYLNKEWVFNNLGHIFTSENTANWRAAMNGFIYAKYLGKIFEYLVENGHFKKALDDDKLKKTSKESLIEYASFNYLISEKSEAISILIDRWNEEEMSKLVWYIWKLRKEMKDAPTQDVISLWEKLYSKLQDEMHEKLLSNLNYWTEFLTSIDKNTKNFMLQCAPYACINYNAPFLVEQLSRLVKNNEKSVAEIYIRMLEKCTPDYDIKHIKHIIKKLKNSGLDREVDQINDHYLDKRYNFLASYLSKLS